MKRKKNLAQPVDFNESTAALLGGLDQPGYPRP